MMTRSRIAVLAVAATVGALLPATAADATSGYHLVWDDFSGGFTSTGPGAKWAIPGAGPWAADDGLPTTSTGGLRVKPKGANPATGQPAFTGTLPQEPADGQGLPGGLDHVKWLAFTNHTASSGYQGFDAVAGQELSCETRMGGRTYGTANHPFGAKVVDPDDDLRLASVGMPVLDPETSMIFDFFVTNKQVYVFYERLLDSRSRLGNYAAFSYTIPVAGTYAGQQHNYKIAYDRSAGVVRWVLDGREVFRVDRIGDLLPTRRNLMLDNGGVPTVVQPRQLSCGMGLFTILDGARPGAADDSALVRLSGAADHYFRPSTGEPTPQTFQDNASLPSSRLFGQGASLSMTHYSVSSVPVTRY